MKERILQVKLGTMFLFPRYSGECLFSSTRGFLKIFSDCFSFLFNFRFEFVDFSSRASLIGG